MSEKIEEKILDVIYEFDKHIRGAGDKPGVIDRTKDYMKKFIDGILTPESRVLDVGAGDCVTADYLEGKVKYWEGINKGIDLINNTEKYNIKKMDMHFLDYEDSSFDIVLCVNVLEHSYFPLMVLSELKRVSSKYIFIDIPMAVGDGGIKSNEENTDHHYLMTKFMWEKMFIRLGLTLLKKEIAGAEVRYLLQK